MGVRKTEQRLPSGFEASDLGEAVSSPDGKTALISFNFNPIVKQRTQSYVLFVTDNTLSSQVEKVEWSFENSDVSNTIVTDAGYIEYQPNKEGELTIEATLRDSSDSAVDNLEMRQQIVPSNTELEELYEQDDEVAPLAGKPETSREVINDFRGYMDELAPRDADVHSSLNRLLFAISYVTITGMPAGKRNAKLEQIAESLDADDPSLLAEKGVTGIGVCQIRPHILGMYMPETPGGSDWYLEKREYVLDDYLSTTRELQKELTALPQEKQIDLFNLLRFPKSNFNMAIQLLQGLRNQYFPSEDLESLINDKENIKLLIDQFKRGPYQSS